jgi:hypothetical protein
MSYKLKKRQLVITALIVVGLLFAYLCLSVGKSVSSTIKISQTRSAENADYGLNTSPLPQNVVDDICSALSIRTTSTDCEAGDVVYAPDLFDEIKAYFQYLPRQDKTYDLVQKKLGPYLDYCENPDTDGNYGCRYDLRGDDVYTVLILFNKDDFYFRILASTSDS